MTQTKDNRCKAIVRGCQSINLKRIKGQYYKGKQRKCNTDETILEHRQVNKIIARGNEKPHANIMDEISETDYNGCKLSRIPTVDNRKENFQLL